MFIEAHSSGRAKVVITDTETSKSSGLLVDYFKLGSIAAYILEAASKARHSGKSLSNSAEVVISYPTIVPTTITVGPCHLPDHDSITLWFGEAALGVAIPRRMLFTLVALGAEGAAN
jgi:hypothetical protein